MSEPNRATTVNVDVKIGGTEIPDEEVISFVVDTDLGQPDMAVITLNNAGHHQTTKAEIAPGKQVEILVHQPPLHVFKGEVVGIEPVYKAGAQNICVVRAFGQLHRMLRGRKSKTFQGPKVKNILEDICRANGMTLDREAEADVDIKHFYQHNQTDLEVVRQLGARLGCSVWCVDKTLHFKKPNLGDFSGTWFNVGKDAGEGGHQIQWFSPRMSSVDVVKEVVVQGWNPEQKKAITGKATAASSKLGKDHASQASAAGGGDVSTFVVDHPIVDDAEAKKIAEAKLSERMMTYITGEAGVNGKAEYKIGTVVGIVVNPDTPTDRFNGKYFVTGCSHKYSRAQGNSKGGYNTVLRVARNAEAPAENLPADQRSG